MEGKLTGLAGIFAESFERSFFSIVILPVFEAPFGFFFDFRDAGMFGNRMGENMDSFLLANEWVINFISMRGAL